MLAAGTPERAGGERWHGHGMGRLGPVLPRLLPAPARQVQAEVSQRRLRLSRRAPSSLLSPGSGCQDPPPPPPPKAPWCSQGSCNRQRGSGGVRRRVRLRMMKLVRTGCPEVPHPNPVSDAEAALGSLEDADPRGARGSAPQL